MNREPSPTLRPKQNPRARYIMIGGFLGAGKTTAVAALAKRLVAQGQRVGLITNDQGRHLVDTAMLRAHGFATEEIPGGCFCCRFNSLVEASRRLTASTRPEVFLAEPVGSCTDLVATVTYPLRRLYGDDFTVAPVSVLVDPVRAERIFGLSQGGAFSSKVRYIYLKQVEEADLVVISKCDLIEAPRWGSPAGSHPGPVPQEGGFGRFGPDRREPGRVVWPSDERRTGGRHGDGGRLPSVCRGRGVAGLAQWHRAAFDQSGNRCRGVPQGVGRGHSEAPAKP
ncbi:MAG: CobW-like GTP-binding protein [Verrucomicrobia bacterium]|nr:CobW-like GTP-binding protein [Verrucomicrobiota bacterium]